MFTNPRITKWKHGEYLNMNVKIGVTNLFLQLKDMTHFLKDLEAVSHKSLISSVVAPVNIARSGAQFFHFIHTSFR